MTTSLERHHCLVTCRLHSSANKSNKPTHLNNYSRPPETLLVKCLIDGEADTGIAAEVGSSTARKDREIFELLIGMGNFH